LAHLDEGPEGVGDGSRPRQGCRPFLDVAACGCDAREERGDLDKVVKLHSWSFLRASASGQAV